MVVSIISPVYNEEKNLENFSLSLKNVLLKKNDNYYNIVFINDNSTDKSSSILNNIQDDNDVKVINLIEHKGQHKAIYEGLKKVISDVYIIIDSDLEYFPKDIEKFIKKIEAGYEVVVGKRSFYNNNSRYKQKLFNNFTKFFLGIKLDDITCPFRGFTRNVRDYILFKGNIESLLLGVKNFKYSQVDIKYRPFDLSYYTIFRKMGYGIIFIIKSIRILCEDCFDKKERYKQNI